MSKLLVAAVLAFIALVSSFAFSRYAACPTDGHDNEKCVQHLFQCYT